MAFLSSLYVSFASAVAFLAQEKPPEPGAPVPGQPGGQVPPPAPGGDMMKLIFPLILCFAVIYFIVMLPERKKQKARQAMIKGVKKGDQVVTTAGIIGKAVRVDEREVVLQVDKDNDVRIQFLKSAIHEVIPEGSESASPKEDRK